jgi:FMN phosphatase YigB (HAD superfamily)
MNNKIILVDCDGVLLDWEAGFEQWMLRKGHKFNPNGYGHFRVSMRYDIDEDIAMDLIHEYNESAACGFLKPLRDSVYYVRRLNQEHGYRFRAITSFGTEPYSIKLREKLLVDTFGDIFDSVVCLGIGEHKEHELRKYAQTGMYWIEDHPRNAEIGKHMGLKSVLIRHDYNQGHDVGPNAIRTVDNWRELYDIIVGA